jgi:beta-glucosidase
MSIKHLIFIISFLIVTFANAKPDPYEKVALVTNSIIWPYNRVTYGNDSFREGSLAEGNADSLLISLISKNKGLPFPNDFVFGVAHSSYQYEGHRVEPSIIHPNGIGWSIWDVFSQKGSWLNPQGNNINEAWPTNQYTQPNGQDAIAGYLPEYHEQDIALAKELGVKAFRLSISWPRLFPHAGMQHPDAEGVQYYQNILKKLKQEGFDVFITLYHWDLPHWLYNFGDINIPENEKAYGWLDLNNAKDNLTIKEYQKYVNVCFAAFGKYTPYFATFNEPLTFTNSALYGGSSHAPGKAGFDILRQLSPEIYGYNQNESEARINYLQASNIIKAHFIAYKTFEKYRLRITNDNQGKSALLGLVVNADWAEPYRIIKDKQGKLQYHPDDIKASKRHMDFMLGWWLEPVMFGDWPQSMKQLVGNRLPSLANDDSCLSKEGIPIACGQNEQTLLHYIRAGGALDYITLNHYTGYFVADLEFAKNNKIPSDQYGGTPSMPMPGWTTDQQTFITQFRNQKYGNWGAYPLNNKSRIYVIGKAGAKPWLRHTYFSYTKLLLYINKYYLVKDHQTKQGTPFSTLGIYLTENGTSIYQESQQSGSKQLNDIERVQFIKGNLAAVWQAIQLGVNVKLYTYWCLADNFEWAEGYDSRFGLIWIDYEHHFSRLLKKSFYYQQVIKNNAVSH